MPQHKFKLMRLKKGENRSIRSDYVLSIKASDPDSDCHAHLMVSEFEGGSILIRLPDKELGNFATAAFQSIPLARLPERTTEAAPRIVDMARAIVPDRIGVLTKPESVAAPDHAVLEIQVGDATLQFSAHKKNWAEILTALIGHSAPSASAN